MGHKYAIFIYNKHRFVRMNSVKYSASTIAQHINEKASCLEIKGNDKIPYNVLSLIIKWEIIGTKYTDTVYKI